MRRRDFITLLGGTVATWPIATRAQRAAMPVIGALFAVSAAEWEDYMAGFRRGLSATGWVAERNVTIEYRWAEDLRSEPARSVPARRGIRTQNITRDQTRRPPRRAADQIRAGHQPLPAIHKFYCWYNWLRPNQARTRYGLGTAR